MSQSRRRHSWNEVIGVLLVGGGVLLLLALLSFEPRDVPPWLFYAKYSSASPIPLNFVGRVGAIIAGLLFFLLGGASFFAAASLLGLGIAKFLGEEGHFGIRFGWSFVFVLSWSFFLDLMDQLQLVSTVWKKTLALPSAGGWFGHALGVALGKNSMGTVGSIFLFLMLMLTSLILATGFHPIHTSRRILISLGKALLWLFLWIKRKFFQRSALEVEEELAISEPKPTRRRSKNKEMEPIPFEEEAEMIGPAELGEFPLPKIIDASVPAPPRKPTLAEVMKVSSPKVAGSSGETALATLSLENYTLPGLDLLEKHESDDRKPADPAVLQAVQKIILETLAQFGIEASPGDITKGPTITRYEVYPASGVRVDRISNLERDLARATRAERINILAPIPGKDTVGIEIANSDKVKVAIRELFDSDAWHSSKAKLPLALGKDVYGNPIIADLAQMPHLLVAGATGSGKSVCINSIITSLIFKHTPENLRFIMIDPKVVEMQIYNKLPHLVTPVVTDPKKVLLALRWVIEEMELRYKIFAKTGVRNITGFNERPEATAVPKEEPTLEEVQELADALAAKEEADNDSLENEEEEPVVRMIPHRRTEAPEIIIPRHMPFIVVIVDELADLMQTAPADVESAIARITQMARAAGIHMIVATQTPRADVVTGIIKANIPTRIAFQVASKLDSRVILDANGADKLLGQGDMLYLPPGSAKVTRAQGVLVTDEEIGKVVEFLATQSKPVFEPSIAEKLSSTTFPEEEITDGEEELVTKCLEIIRQEKRASTSMLQRRLRLGYTRAARVVDILEQRGILGPKDGARDREILIDLESL
ncbi:MAG: DNA translocase FtsK 4TM domain-containing protein [Verrucomicrobiae bacterium]|nr:DNA translocase FtsK 4TM domain-containing protein [Verrucomicrobiae bacterium]